MQYMTAISSVTLWHTLSECRSAIHVFRTTQNKRSIWNPRLVFIKSWHCCYRTSTLWWMELACEHTNRYPVNKAVLHYGCRIIIATNQRQQKILSQRQGREWQFPLSWTWQWNTSFKTRCNYFQIKCLAIYVFKRSRQLNCIKSPWGDSRVSCIKNLQRFRDPLNLHPQGTVGITVPWGWRLSGSLKRRRFLYNWHGYHPVEILYKISCWWFKSALAVK
jgi:hypothetical protein